jgi:hypothetical protein
MELETSALDEKIAKENPDADDRALADDGRSGGAARPAGLTCKRPDARKKRDDARRGVLEPLS